MSEHHEVIVIGAGISGIAAAIKLREAGVDDIVILEKAETSAAPGATTATRAAPATSRPTCTRSRSRPTPTGRALLGPAAHPGLPGGVAETSGCAHITRFDVEVHGRAWDNDELPLE